MAGQPRRLGQSSTWEHSRHLLPYMDACVAIQDILHVVNQHIEPNSYGYQSSPSDFMKRPPKTLFSQFPSFREHDGLLVADAEFERITDHLVSVVKNTFPGTAYVTDAEFCRKLLFDVGPGITLELVEKVQNCEIYTKVSYIRVTLLFCGVLRHVLHCDIQMGDPAEYDGFHFCLSLENRNIEQQFFEEHRRDTNDFLLCLLQMQEEPFLQMKFLSYLRGDYARLLDTSPLRTLGLVFH